MRKSGVIFAVILASGLSCACLAGASSSQSPECAPAVDRAESLNVQTMADCDYSETGLNGYLHKALADKSDAKDLDASGVESPGVAVGTATQIQSGEKFLQLDIKTWSGLPQGRNELLSRGLRLCSKGFSIARESYLPVASGDIRLILQIVCLK